MSQVKAIYARAINGVMGNNYELPWSVPADMKRFKRLTSGCIVVMGYNTWLSLGCKPLPNRKNVVIFDRKRLVSADVMHESVTFSTSLETVMGVFRADSRTVWVIGGPALIAEAMHKFDAEVHRSTLGIAPEGNVLSERADDAIDALKYVRVGYEQFKCGQSGVPVTMERLVKPGIDAGTK